MFTKRKYLTEKEREEFLYVSQFKSDEIRLFCNIMCDTGARISECLSISPNSLKTYTNYIFIESLKKRAKGKFRRVPLSRQLHHGLLKYAESHAIPENDRIWNWSRMTAYRRVKEVMLEAKIDFSVAHPKALRHGFAIAALSRGIPVNLVQRWLGHEDIETTTIYTNFVGDEELEFARRLWRELGPLSIDPGSRVTEAVPALAECQHMSNAGLVRSSPIFRQTVS